MPQKSFLRNENLQPWCRRAHLGTATEFTRGERSADLRIGIHGITTLAECRGGARRSGGSAEMRPESSEGGHQLNQCVHQVYQFTASREVRQPARMKPASRPARLWPGRLWAGRLKSPAVGCAELGMVLGIERGSMQTLTRRNRAVKYCNPVNSFHFGRTTDGRNRL